MKLAVVVRPAGRHQAGVAGQRQLRARALVGRVPAVEASSPAKPALGAARRRPLDELDGLEPEAAAGGRARPPRPSPGPARRRSAGSAVPWARTPGARLPSQRSKASDRVGRPVRAPSDRGEVGAADALLSAGLGHHLLVGRSGCPARSAAPPARRLRAAGRGAARPARPGAGLRLLDEVDEHVDGARCLERDVSRRRPRTRHELDPEASAAVGGHSRARPGCRGRSGPPPSTRPPRPAPEIRSGGSDAVGDGGVGVQVDHDVRSASECALRVGGCGTTVVPQERAGARRATPGAVSARAHWGRGRDGEGSLRRLRGLRPGRGVAQLTFDGLYALQHRGQESAGMARQRRRARSPS